MAKKVVITLDDRLYNELRCAANTYKMSVEKFIAAFLWEHSAYNDCKEQYVDEDSGGCSKMKPVSDINVDALLESEKAAKWAAYEALRGFYSAEKWRELSEKHPNGMKIYRLATGAGEDVSLRFFDVSMTRVDIYKAAINEYGYKPDAYVDMKIIARVDFVKSEVVLYKMNNKDDWQRGA